MKHNTFNIFNNVNRQIPFVQRDALLSRRGGYSTTLSTRYEGWVGLFDTNHGQHTMILIEYE